MHWMFTKREERHVAGARARGDLSGAYVVEATDAFRHQLLYAVANLAPPPVGFFGEENRQQFFQVLHRMLLEEYGLGALCRDARPAGPQQDLVGFILSSASTAQLMDVVDAAPLALVRTAGGGVYGVVHMEIEHFRTTIASRMAEQRLPYDVVSGRVISKDSDAIHAEVVVPALTLLHGKPRFERVEAQYQDALRELAAKRWADAITDANAAVELTLRHILGFQQGQLPDLLGHAKMRGLFGDPQTARLKKLTDGLSVLADIRNSEGDAHGGESDRGTAWLAVHIAGALIVYLAEQAAVPTT
jgi:hypothetical protein